MSAHLGSVVCSDCDAAGTASLVDFLGSVRTVARIQAADFNSTADQIISIDSTKWILHRIFVAIPDGDLTGAVGGIYTGAGKTGSQVVLATQDYTGLVLPTNYKDLNITAFGDTTVFTSGTLYFSLTTPCGSAFTADIYVEYDDLDPVPVESVLSANGQTCTKYYNIPGSKGATGLDGADGANGAASFTLTTAPLTQPIAAASVVVAVASGACAAVGMIVFVEGAGYYEVTASAALSLTLKNLNYDANVPPATVVGAGVKVVAAGEKGQETGTTVLFDAVSPTTTKGDVIAHNGTTNVRVPVGVDDYMVLRVSAASAQSLLWERINLGSWTFVGTLPVASGGTASATASGARTNLGAAKNGINTDITQANGLTHIKIDQTNGAGIDGIFSNSAVLNFGSILSGSTEDLTIAVTGAAVNDTVFLGLPAAPAAGIMFQGFVSAPDVVTVRANNFALAPVNPASETYKVTVVSHA